MENSNKEKQIEEKTCEKCLHYRACLINSEYFPESPCCVFDRKSEWANKTEGEWVKHEHDFWGVYYTCSACKCDVARAKNYQFCPDCGAKMSGGVVNGTE